MNRTTAASLAATAALGLTATMVAAAPAQADRSSRKGPQAIGLTTDQKLVSFAVARPGKSKRLGAVTGLSGDTKLVGIDYRVQDRRLYGVGDQGGVYTLSTRTAKATKVSQLTVALSGGSFGVDFNPAADRLRVVSDTGQNLRHDVTGGVTVADTGLTYPPATTPATGITAAAYTNNDLATDTATTLFDIDTALDQVALQAPANAGTLSATGMLGVDAGTDAGFDIYSYQRKGSTRANVGVATLSVGGGYRLYKVSLLTGDAHAIGAFSKRSQVADVAVKLG